MVWILCVRVCVSWLLWSVREKQMQRQGKAKARQARQGKGLVRNPTDANSFLVQGGLLSVRVCLCVERIKETAAKARDVARRSHTYANGHSRFWFWYFKQLRAAQHCSV